MPTHSEVARLNLEYYCKQAKALLKAAKSGDVDAVQRLQRHLPRSSATPALHDAQLAIAREEGFPSWPKFKAFIEQSKLNFKELVASFISAATSDRRRADEILARHPKIADAGFYVALVLGRWKVVEQTLLESPELANAESGPEDCAPLIYTCFSRYANGKSERAADLTETVRVLLRHGADPSVTYTPDNSPGYALSALYAASGLNNNPEMARALLEAGGNPNDGESLYHSTEHPDLECMKLLLRHGAKVNGSNSIKHVLDREDRDGLTLLLDAGGDPDEKNERGETALHWAVWRGRSPETLAILLDHGANINAKRNDDRTGYALAVISGQKESATLLRERGAVTELSALDGFVDRCVNGGKKYDGKPVAIDHVAGSERLLPDLAANHYTEAVRALLDAGLPLDARGGAGGTALHWACWKGYPDVAKLLLDHGAPLNINDTEFHASPLGWLHHGSTNYRGCDADHAEVVRVMIAAGVPMNELRTPTGNPKVDAVLREHRLVE